MTKFKVHSNRILISFEHKKVLKKEFDTSKQTVQMALDYYNNSDLAQRIRHRAMILLKKEAQKISNRIKESNNNPN